MKNVANRQTIKQIVKTLDLEYKEETISSVREESGGWAVKMSDGWSYFIQKKWGVEPKRGQTIRLYGGGIGRPIRGVDIDGKECFYLTPAEQKEKDRRWAENKEKEDRATFKKNSRKLARKFHGLPRVFQRRIEKFRTNNPDFRWRYESYEMFVCEQAVIIARALKSAKAIVRWREKSDKEMRAQVPLFDEGHSGNTFGAACFLAQLYLECPEGVVKQHGAMVPFVGSKEYGCVPRDPEEKGNTDALPI